MTYSEAQAEFCVRLYRWAQSAQEKEIREGFPRFKLSKEWSNLVCHFFQSLDQDSQKLFGVGLLQTRHQIAIKVLGEAISDESRALLLRAEAFRSQYAWKRGSVSDPHLGKHTLASRRELKKAITTHFQTAFGDRCYPINSSNGSSSGRFEMACRGWTIRTEFEFGRWDPEITCVHDIWTGKLITKEEPPVLFANCLGFQLNYGHEIGIGSGWEGIATEDIEQTCRLVVDHCRRMLEVFPVLLEGLDLDLLTEN